MADQTDSAYSHECLRAELLGLPKPDRASFVENYQPASEEQIESETFKEIDGSNSTANHISGGLDELNSILQVTQRKLNSFKASCGSFTNLLKSKIARAPEETRQENVSEELQQPTTSESEDCRGKSDLTRALDNHVDKLDGLIDKVEVAHDSTKSQTSLMKRLLNK